MSNTIYEHELKVKDLIADYDAKIDNLNKIIDQKDKNCEKICEIDKIITKGIITMQSKVYNDLKISNVDLFNLISKDFSDLNIEQFDLNLNIENCDPNIDYIYLKSTS